MVSKSKNQGPEKSPGASFCAQFWRARQDLNPQPLGPKPSALSVELQARLAKLVVLGRATGFEPVVSCATDRRLRPLGYARRALGLC